MKKFMSVLICAACLCMCGCGGATQDRTVHAPDGTAIAELTVFATGERGKVSPMLAAEGHAYCSVKNVSDRPVVLGKGYVLPEGGTVTIASWEFDAHAGIWYNIEPTYVDQGWFVERKSVTREIDGSALERMNEYLTDGGTDKWTLFQNCTHFAVGLWNAAADGSGDEIDFKGLTPSVLEKEIMRFNGYETGRSHESELPIGYYSGDEFTRFTLAD